MIPPANCPRPSFCKPSDHTYFRTASWVCHACNRKIKPQDPEAAGEFTAEEIARLDALRRLHSNGGFGDAFRSEPIIACRVANVDY